MSFQFSIFPFQFQNENWIALSVHILRIAGNVLNLLFSLFAFLKKIDTVFYISFFKLSRKRNDTLGTRIHNSHNRPVHLGLWGKMPNMTLLRIFILRHLIGLIFYMIFNFLLWPGIKKILHQQVFSVQKKQKKLKLNKLTYNLGILFLLLWSIFERNMSSGCKLFHSHIICLEWKMWWWLDQVFTVFKWK